MKNKVVIITGGAGVLGSSMASELAKQGAKLAVLDLNKENAEAVVHRIKNDGGEAIAVEADVLSLESLKRAHKTIKQSFGSCDILVNGAGGNHPKGTTSKTHLDFEDINDSSLTTFYDLDPKGIEFVFNLNFLGTLLPTQVFSRDMIEKKEGLVINISSMNAFTPLTKIPAYSGAKAAVSNFTQWLAVHFSKVNIRVNALAPGFFLTDQNRSLLTNDDGSLTQRGQQILDQTPMGRFGNPEDLNSTLLWLCDSSTSFVTGVVVPIDGGFNAYSGV